MISFEFYFMLNLRRNCLKHFLLLAVLQQVLVRAQDPVDPANESTPDDNGTNIGDTVEVDSGVEPEGTTE